MSALLPEAGLAFQTFAAAVRCSCEFPHHSNYPGRATRYDRNYLASVCLVAVLVWWI
jgi:hypothetical protein